jgi:hypothetical protein
MNYSYQQYENLYHFTRQINPITLSNVSAQSRDPSNLPTDMRITLYDGIDGMSVESAGGRDGGGGGGN